VELCQLYASSSSGWRLRSLPHVVEVPLVSALVELGDVNACGLLLESVHDKTQKGRGVSPPTRRWWFISSASAHRLSFSTLLQLAPDMRLVTSEKNLRR
jgi:hypothetical protein